ncbi:alpha/beta hydrolase [Bosea caraganae]|uniref:Alpha/beta hydrolase n=2 Tax=Bosea caraganae TaxID=2763117 RepID=A0A370L0C0_9HYPH|nr:alpha/beta hydrolase [Bosea caraganae]RDJ23999.1 alpha/beta hydrolase [Bosea caraganae]
MIDGFAQRKLPGHGIEIDALIGGSGPPLLLLHGAPQTRVCWRQVAPALAEHFTVVVPDLRGYGRSDKPEGGGDFSAYSKRTMALDQIASMRALGFDRFDVAGHDRGGRVAYRLALDHPDAVRRLAVLDIIPTLDAFENYECRAGYALWHWTLQSQPAPLPERMIGADPDYFMQVLFAAHTHEKFAFDEYSLSDYLSCMRDPATIHGMCEDYRSAWWVDRHTDAEDRGSRAIEVPTLVLWGANTVAARSPLETWRKWASDVRGEGLPSGHFLPEEAPSETAAHLLNFFK